MNTRKIALTIATQGAIKFDWFSVGQIVTKFDDYNKIVEIEVYEGYRENKTRSQNMKTFISLYYEDGFKSVFVVKGNSLNMNVILHEGDSIEMWGKSSIFDAVNSDSPARVFVRGGTIKNNGETLRDAIVRFQEANEEGYTHFALHTMEAKCVIISGFPD